MAPKQSPKGWDLQESSYDPDEFYVRSTNQFGVGTTQHVKFPNEIVGEMAAIVARQTHPQLRTTHDFVRNAVIHELHKRAKQDNDDVGRRIVNAEIVMCNTFRYVDEMKQLDKIVTQMKEGIALCKQHDDHEMLATVVVEAERSVHEIDMREPYRSRVMSEIKEAVRFLPEGYRRQIETHWDSESLKRG